MAHPLPLTDPTDATLGVGCRVFSTHAPETAISCAAPGRLAVTQAETDIIRDELRRRAQCGSDAECALLQVCELQQLTGTDFPQGSSSCLNDEAPTSDGWCYLDSDLGLGNAALLQQCPAGNLRRVRFTGGGAPTNSSAVYMLCAGQR